MPCCSRTKSRKAQISGIQVMDQTKLTDHSNRRWISRADRDHQCRRAMMAASVGFGRDKREGEGTRRPVSERLFARRSYQPPGCGHFPFTYAARNR